MSIENYDEVYAGHLWIARVGNTFTTPSAGTVSRDTAPAATSDAWRKLPDVQNFSLSAEVERRTKRGIDVGRRIRTKMIVVQRDVALTGEVNSHNKQWYDTLLGSDEAASDDFASHGTQSEEYWVRIQTYSTGDVNRVIIQGLASVMIDGDLSFDDDFPSATFKADFLGRLSGSFVDAYTS